MTNVFSMKPVKGWMKVAVIGLGLPKALGGCTFGAYVVEVAAGIKGAAGIVNEDIIERVIVAAQRGLEFFTGAKRIQFAQVHNRDAITIALRFLQVMGREEQGRSIVGTQINEMFPNSVAGNGGQSDGRLIEEEHPRPMQRGLGDFQAADHAAGVLPHQATALLASGQTGTPLRALIWLAAIQRTDGRFPQNSWINGDAYWSGVQLDEVAAPILLAWRLPSEGVTLGRFDPCVMISRAAGYLIRQGPVTAQERWEENAGYSPSTLATVIAGLVCAPGLPRQTGKGAPRGLFWCMGGG